MRRAIINKVSEVPRQRSKLLGGSEGIVVPFFTTKVIR